MSWIRQKTRRQEDHKRKKEIYHKRKRKRNIKARKGEREENEKHQTKNPIADTIVTYEIPESHLTPLLLI